MSVDLPVGWRRVDPTSADFAALATKAGAADPAIGQQLQQVAAAGLAERFRFYAVDRPAEQALGITSIMSVGPAGAMPGAAIADAIAAQLRKAGAADLARSETTLLGVPATVFRYRLETPGLQGASTDQAMFVFELDGQVHFASFSCMSAATTCPVEGESMIRSARTP
ncbi:MAG: hypothetical protein ACJ77X_05550 [Chloroflexota bacterium]